MRTPILLLVLAVVLCCIAADQPVADLHPLLPTALTKQMVESKPPPIPLHRLKFDGQDYMVSNLNLGYGVAHTQIGIYAPQEDGTFRLCLFAESWAAGSLQPTLDEKTGILELRESANSKLKGEVVLTCNLKTIGTQSSTHTK